MKKVVTLCVIIESETCVDYRICFANMFKTKKKKKVKSIIIVIICKIVQKKITYIGKGLLT